MRNRLPFPRDPQKREILRWCGRLETTRRTLERLDLDDDEREILEGHEAEIEWQLRRLGCVVETITRPPGKRYVAAKFRN